MANIVQQDFLVWLYFTQESSYVKCIFCNRRYILHCTILLITHRLKSHIEQEHPQIIRGIKEQIKLTWLSRYFAFNIKCKIIRCIFCEKDIEVLDGVNYLRYHLLGHNIHEDTINYLKDDETMQLKLSPEIFEKIIQKIRDEIRSAGLSLYFIFNTLKYGYTKMKCARCDDHFNILLEKQILKEHLFLYHYISK